MRGNGCVPIYNLMEDAATAEICRAQVWQWVKHGAKLNDGRAVTAELVRRTIADVTEGLRGSIGGDATLARGAHLRADDDQRRFPGVSDAGGVRVYRLRKATPAPSDFRVLLRTRGPGSRTTPDICK